MVSRKDLISKLTDWEKGKISNWKISNWAISKIFTQESFEDNIVEELIDMISNVGADLDFCTTLSPKQYLHLVNNTDYSALEEELEGIDGEREEELEDLYPTKAQFIQSLEINGWFEGEDQEYRQRCKEMIEFKALPNLESQYFKDQEVFWLRLCLPNAIYNDQIDGDIVGEFNFDFIDQLDPISNVRKYCSNGSFIDTVSFDLEDHSYSIQLPVEQLTAGEIIVDFFNQFKAHLSNSRWELIYSDSYLDIGDLMFLILVDKKKLLRMYESGVFRSIGEETSHH